jgi:hypothetical protein
MSKKNTKTNKKKVPNPNGRKGGELHQKKTKEIKDGKSRFADIVAINSDGDIEEIYQVGKQNKNGKPVKRERDAMDDIEKMSGMKVIFRPYNIFILILIAIALPFLIT